MAGKLYYPGLGLGCHTLKRRIVVTNGVDYVSTSVTTDG
jgi:hypothetical protein